MISNSNKVTRFDEFICEATQQEYKDFFRSKINWKFLQTLIDSCLEFIDKGININFGVVSFIDTLGTKSWVYDGTDNYYTPTQDKMTNVIGIFNEHESQDGNNIYYRLIVGFYDTGKDKEREDIFDKIIRRISSIYSINYEYINNYIVDIELKDK